MQRYGLLAGEEEGGNISLYFACFPFPFCMHTALLRVRCRMRYTRRSRMHMRCLAACEADEALLRAYASAYASACAVACAAAACETEEEALLRADVRIRFRIPVDLEETREALRIRSACAAAYASSYQ